MTIMFWKYLQIVLHGGDIMRYIDAKKLHNEDEVIYKYNNISLYVVETKIDTIHKEVYVLCDDGNWYHHRVLK